MTWTVRNAPDSPYVEGIFKGPTSWQEIRDMTARCIAIQKAQNVARFLIDTGDMKPTASIADVYQLPAHETFADEIGRQANQKLSK